MVCTHCRGLSTKNLTSTGSVRLLKLKLLLLVGKRLKTGDLRSGRSYKHPSSVKFQDTTAPTVMNDWQVEMKA